MSSARALFVVCRVTHTVELAAVTRELPDDYVIDVVGWRLPEHQPGSPYTLEDAREEFWALFSFLQDQGLVRRRIVRSRSEITPTTELLAGDLTDEGVELIRTGYQRWLAALDRAGPQKRREKANDVRILERSLALIRGGKADHSLPATKAKKPKKSFRKGS